MPIDMSLNISMLRLLTFVVIEKKESSCIDLHQFSNTRLLIVNRLHSLLLLKDI